MTPLNGKIVPEHVGLTTFKDKLRRAIWNAAYSLFFRRSPRMCFSYRRWLLKVFGAQLGEPIYTYPTTRIYAPWNLQMGNNSTLGPDVDCYSMAKICIGDNTVVSQYSYLCSGSHDITHPAMPLIFHPINLGEGVWVCADVFVGPGVTIGDGAVVGARSSVFRDVEPWTIVGGNPARFIKPRIVDRK
jgi:putative colanic acid biosynthesis acetyltransferase WcaF